MKYLKKVQSLPTELEENTLYYATEGDGLVGFKPKPTETWELDPTKYIEEDGKYYEYLYDPTQRTIEDTPAIIDLNGNEWTKFDEDDNYDYYKSMNKGINSSYYQFCVTWSGVENVQFLYRSYAESVYDFLVVGNLDGDKFTSFPSTSSGQAHTMGKQTETYNTLNITCSTDEHHIWFCYRKDSSDASNDDTAYVGVPKLQTITDGKTKKGEELSVSYSVDNISSPSVEWSATTATITYDGNTILSNGLVIGSKLSQVVEFEQNSPQGEGTPMQFTANTEYVDLGLPSGLKWAKCNLGATEETGYGAYFSWGDTNGYARAADKGGTSTARDITDKFLWNDVEVNYTVKQGGANGSGFSWETEKWNGGASDYDETYFVSVSGQVMNSDKVLLAENDAAHVHMGDGWKMPTREEMAELRANTTSTWTQVNNVNGVRFTSKTDSSKYIFIPAAGCCTNGYVDDVRSRGYVWSSSLSPFQSYGAEGLGFGSSNAYSQGGRRYDGYSVRGVKNS